MQKDYRQKNIDILYEKNLKKVLTYIRRFARLFNALTYSANIRHGEVSKWS